MAEHDDGYRAQVVARGRDDAALVAAIRVGDRSAFAELYDRHGPRIEAFCARILGDLHLGADAAQDTFVLAAQRIDQLRDPGSVRAWLYAIARNECTRTGRRRARLVPIEDRAMSEDLDEPVGADRTGDAAVAADHASLVWAAAGGLADADRTLLELQLRHGLEGAELAAAAGVPAGQISMATGRLRDRLERSIGALLVARGARDGCPALGVVLADWDGTYSVLVRKRVARHIERCEHCTDRRATLVAPLGSLALAPLALPVTFPAVSAAQRARVLSAVARALDGLPAVGGAADAADPSLAPGPDGFPPVPDDWWDDPDPAPVDRDAQTDAGAAVAADLRPGGPDPTASAATGSGTTLPRAAASSRRRPVLVALAALLLLGGALLVWASAGDDRDARIAAAAPAAGTARSGSEEPASRDRGETSAPAGTPSVTSSPPPEATIPPTTTTTTTPPDTDTGPSPTAVPGPTPPPSTAPPVTLSPPTAPAPNLPPVVGAPSSSGDGSMQTTCNPADDTRTIAVTVADDRGVAGVVLRWTHTGSGPGQRTMTKVGASTWRAALGPFAEAGSVSYRAVATDSDGASSSSPSASVTVDPCPG